ncbi:MAG: DUF4364 family protein [Lachnospiraceae bacterium]|nr:DUF4364 family protein [Lachnospiraceae bacterium]MDD3660497.1 DUF4364 family protein [Lachnospiraceae bacterium]
MIQDAVTIYKLIILYMLGRVDFALTKGQVDDFILEREYTNYLTLQQVLTELTDADLIQIKSIRNRTYLTITEEGKRTLSYFDNRISDSIKEDIDSYLKANELKLRNEVSVQSDYYKSTSGEYEAHLTAKEKGVTLVEIRLSVPLPEMASMICDNWTKKNQEIYQYLTEKLF